MSTEDSAEAPSIRHHARLVDLQPLADVIACLRAPDGCPWDLEQTHQSLKRYAVEEVYELTDAIDAADDGALREELGDVLLQVVLHAQIAAERDAFTLQEVADGIRAKMIARHPHVFAENHDATREEVESNWKAAKRKEGRTTLGGVPRSMPPLARADRISRRAAAVGFDFPDANAAMEKVDEELLELSAALEHGDRAEIRGELGDVLFAVANVVRKLGFEAGDCLRSTLEKFEQRFGYVESTLSTEGRTLEDANLDEMEALWQASKRPFDGDNIGG